jgi:hypothetical protein
MDPDIVTRLNQTGYDLLATLLALTASALLALLPLLALAASLLLLLALAPALLSLRSSS